MTTPPAAGSLSATPFDTRSEPGPFCPVTGRPQAARLPLQQLDQRLEGEVRGEEVILDRETSEYLKAPGYLDRPAVRLDRSARFIYISEQFW